MICSTSDCQNRIRNRIPCLQLAAARDRDGRPRWDRTLHEGQLEGVLFFALFFVGSLYLAPQEKMFDANE